MKVGVGGREQQEKLKKVHSAAPLLHSAGCVRCRLWRRRAWFRNPTAPAIGNGRSSSVVYSMGMPAVVVACTSCLMTLMLLCDSAKTQLETRSS